jgi:acetyltransferase-like isoleucine patch superfamily enzyme
VPSESIRNLFEKLRQTIGHEMMEKWQRILPLDEMVADRWKKSEMLGFGEGSNIYENAYVYGDPKVGKNVWIGPFVLLDGTGGLEIGDGCSIASGVHIYTHSVQEWVVSEGEKPKTKKPVKIGDYVAIGANATVLPGVTIGDHTIIGAGSVVTEDIPPRSTAVGVPAKVRNKSEVEE